MNALRNEIRTRLRGAQIAYQGLIADEKRVYVRITQPADLEKAKALLADLLAPVPSDQGEPVREVVFLEPEPSQLTYTLTDAGIDHRVRSAADKSVEILYRRTYELYLERVVEREGGDRIRVRVSGHVGLEAGRPAATQRTRRVVTAGRCATISAMRVRWHWAGSRS